jgi:hypothetical protein
MGNHAALMIALTDLIENALAYAPSGSLVGSVAPREISARVAVQDQRPRSGGGRLELTATE